MDTKVTTRGVHDTAPDGLTALVTSWRRSLAARRASPATIDTYSTAVGQLADFLAAHGMPDRATTIRREHVEAFVTDLLEHKAPATEAGYVTARLRPLAARWRRRRSWLAGTGSSPRTSLKYCDQEIGAAGNA
jgi:hypothetical protein